MKEKATEKITWCGLNLYPLFLTAAEGDAAATIASLSAAVDGGIVQGKNQAHQ